MLIAATLLFVLVPQVPPPAAAPAETVAIEGRVVDLRGDGVPAAALAISAAGEPGVVLAKGVSDGDGFFRIARVPARVGWQVAATKSGLCTGIAYASAPPKALRVQMHDAATVRGVLRDRAGKPVAGAAVRARLAARILYSVVCDATTDESGAFVLNGVPLGPVRIAAVVPGEGLAEVASFVQRDADVALAPGDGASTALAIEVVGVPKDAVRTLRASILPYSQGSLAELPPPWCDPVFADAGRCELQSVPDLEYRVRLRADGFAFEPEQRVVKAGTGPHRLQFSARPVGTAELQCKAVLRGPDDKPLAGVRLVMRRFSGGEQMEAVSGEDGSVEFASKLGVGTKVIVYSLDPLWVLHQEKKEGMDGAWDRRFLIDHECKVDPATLLELRAAPACSVRGTLRLPDGRPAAFVDVELEEESANRLPRWMAFAHATTDRNGAYEIARRHWLPDPVRIQVDGVAGSACSEPFALDAPGMNVTVPELTLGAPAVVEGLVLDAGQHPAPGVRVWLRDWDMASGNQRSGSVVEVIADRQGRFRFVGVPPGGAYLQVLIGGSFVSAQAVPPFAVEAGGTYTFELAAPTK